jgi:Integrase core domain
MPCGAVTGCLGVSSSINGGPFVSPTGLGEVVRVCLHQLITPVFIPSREPWRNGTIEHFNDTFDKRFFRQERFTGLEHLAERAGAFERFHNAQHRYSATRGRTADESDPATKRAPRAAEQIPAGWPKTARSSSSGLSAPTSDYASSAAPSRCQTTAPTSTSSPHSIYPSPTRTTS